MAKPATINKPILAILCVTQFLFALPALAIVAFFQYSLWKDKYSIPWEFTILDLAAVLTIINIILTSVLLCCTRLAALYILLSNTLLTFLWALGTGTLLKALGRTTTASCSTNKWGNAEGVKVCQMYKALVALCVLSTLIAMAVAMFGVFARQSSGGDHQYKPALNPGLRDSQAGMLAGEAKMGGRESTLSMGTMGSVGHAQVDTSYGGPKYAAPEATYQADAQGREPLRHVNPDYHT